MDIQQHLRDQAIVLRNALNVTLPLLWRRVCVKKNQDLPQINRFLILLSDPTSATGSLGDAAMLAGLMQSLRQRFPGCGFLLIGTYSQQVDIPGIGGVDVIEAWSGWGGSLAFDDLVRKHSAFYVLGADVMDGAYGAALVCRMATYCNHAVQIGIPATIVGFSFNLAPRRAAVHALSNLLPGVKINIRDPLSLSRFAEATRIKATLCADVAFLMKPAHDSGTGIEAWIQEAKNNNLIPVGININAHAFSAVIAEMGEDAFVTAVGRELSTAAARCNLAFLLIPHDVKPKCGDIRLLESLEKELNRHGTRAVRRILVTEPDKIKCIVGLLALVVTGRMHLAIAALGMKTPVVCITYQDKFEGLFEHFDLDREDLIDPWQCITPSLNQRISCSIARLEACTSKISAKLPQIELLSQKNAV